MFERHYGLALASLNLTRRDIQPTLTAALTTIAFNNNSLRGLEVGTSLPTSKDLPSSVAGDRESGGLKLMGRRKGSATLSGAFHVHTVGEGNLGTATRPGEQRAAETI